LFTRRVILFVHWASQETTRLYGTKIFSTVVEKAATGFCFGPNIRQSPCPAYH